MHLHTIFTTWLRTRSGRLAASAAATAGLVLVLLPLVGLIGVESALILGLVLPTFAVLAGARMMIAEQRAAAPRPGDAILAAAVMGAVLVALPAALLALNALRVPWCEPLENLVFLLLGPGMGVPMAAVIGALLAWMVRPAWLATMLAALLPASEIALAAHRLWSSPAIFAYGHFFGYFPGTFYDLGLEFPPPYLAFRAVSCAIVLAVFAVALAADAARHQRYGAKHVWAWLFIAAIAFSGVSVADVHADELGYATSRRWIHKQLGKRLVGRHCALYLPRELERSEARLLRSECDFWVARLADELGVKPPTRVTAYLFRNPQEKQALVGAAHTMIAKPWRSEIYLQDEAWPHPVMAHEVAHVVAAALATGPFKVAGRFGGLLPDPAIVEGLAVALAWDHDEELTPHQWARALRQIDKAPSLASVFGLSFLGQAPARVYTIAGSALRFVMERYGAGALRQLYRTADLTQATGMSVEQLEREWQAFLAEVPLPVTAAALAEDRFARGSIFSQPCPHTVAELQRDLRRDVLAGDPRQARLTCQDILDIEPQDYRTRAWLVWAQARGGAVAKGRRLAQALAADTQAPLPIVSMAEEHLGDIYWRRGAVRTAQRFYRRAMAKPITQDQQRVLQVKLLGVELPAAQRQLLRQIFISPDDTVAGPAAVVHLARELGVQRDDGLPAYLEGRQLMFAGEHELASQMLERALNKELPTDLLRNEAQRLLGEALFASSEFEQARKLWMQRFEEATTATARQEALRWLQRLEYVRTNAGR